MAQIQAKLSKSGQNLGIGGHNIGLSGQNDGPQVRIGATCTADHLTHLRLFLFLYFCPPHRYQADVLILDEMMTEQAFTKIQNLSDVYPHITTVVGRDCSGKDLDSLTGSCARLLPRSGVMALSKFPILETHGLIYKYAASGTWDSRSVRLFLVF